MDGETREDGRQEWVLYLAAGLSAVAALAHLWAMPEHMREWWGYGTFFLVLAVAQGAYSMALLRWPRRPLFLVGIGANVGILLLYLVTRTVGIPFFGPHAGVVEGVGFVDLCAAVSETGIVLALGALVLRAASYERRLQVAIVLTAAALVLGHVLHLLAGRGAPGHGS